MFKTLFGKQNICALCFIFLDISFNHQLLTHIIKFGRLTAVQYSMRNTCSQRTERPTAHPQTCSNVDKLPQNHEAHRQLKCSYNIILLITSKKMQ